jgi:general secretion pathway protein K
VALLTVLVVLALLTTLSALLVEDQHLSIRRAENIVHGEQAWQLALSSEAWAARLLVRDQLVGGADHLQETWNQTAPAVQVEHGQMQTLIEDAQGRFNLNNLAAGRKSAWFTAFQRLLELLGREPALAHAVADWIDEDSSVDAADGAEDDTYLLGEPAYRAANRFFSDVSELALVHGWSAEDVQRVAPFVTAIPQQGLRINVNTCAPELLRVLSSKPMDAGTAAMLLEARPYRVTDDLLRHPVLAGESATAAELAGVGSGYFYVTSRIQYGRIRFDMVSLLQRSASGQISAVSRRRNYP